MLPNTLPDKFATDLTPESWVQLAQLFDGSYPITAILPQRPGEDSQTWEFRRKSLVRRFPLKRAFTQVRSALSTQTLNWGESLAEQYWPEPEEFVGELAQDLLVFGKVWLLPLVGTDGPEPMLVTPDKVLVSGEGLLIWRELIEDEFNPDTLDVRSYVRVHLFRAGEYGVYETDVKRLRLPTIPGVTPLGLTQGLKDSHLKLVGSVQALPDGWPKCFKFASGGSPEIVDTVVAYLRVKASILDIVATSGYIQRVLKPEQTANLDLPVDLDDYDTSARHLIKADKFVFSEMAGTSLMALSKVQEDLEDEQLAEVGLNLTAGAGASGQSREIDAGRFKALADSLGQSIQGIMAQLGQQYLAFQGISVKLLPTGLSDYDLSGHSGLLDTTTKTADLFLKVPYDLGPDVWSELVSQILGKVVKLNTRSRQPEAQSLEDQ